MLDGETLALVVVGPDVGERTADHAPHRDDRRNGQRPLLRERPGVGAARRAHDDAGDIVLAKRPQHLGLPRRVFVGVGEDRREAQLIKCVLDPRGELGEERVGEIADDHADKVGRGRPQARGAAVVDIAERAHRLGDALSGSLGDQRTSGKDEGHRRFGDAGALGDVDDRHAACAFGALLPRSLGHYPHPTWNVPIIP